ncbi:PREDICTED: uncharacterized protein C4orf3 homolog [Chrysochloris asiatica]|uniref:Uncharacterized protein C4orf3 homolog n=1 Tax=Chrysochloris asiatica TaxID=185453 RepID=A0A9B0U949_CHRAS|nr:PREDICTED: uncharacterized protein C4orf3 homolog [Chrysochloris asiatica]
MDRGADAVGGRDRLRERRDLKEAGRQEQNPDERSQPMIPKHSYWLDLWFFIALDLVLFLVVYFMPWRKLIVFQVFFSVILIDVAGYKAESRGLNGKGGHFYKILREAI